MATFDDIIASVLDAENVGKRKPKGVQVDKIFPNEKYDDNETVHQKLRRGQRIPSNLYFRDPPIPPEDTNDFNVIMPNDKMFEYQDNNSVKENAKFKGYRKA